MGVTRAGQPSDRVLWNSALDGDGNAFGIIFDRYMDRVFSQCLRRLGVREDAEDVAASVFFEAWRVRDRVRFVEESVLPWLLVVTSHLCSKHLRSQHRRRRHLATLPPPEPVPDLAVEVGDAMDQATRAARLAAAISTLSQNEQRLVVLCDLGELTYAEAAAVLNIPVGTVRSRLSRGHAKLRRQLAPLEQPNADRASGVLDA